MEKAGVIIIQSIEEGIFGGKEFVFKDYEDNKIIYHQSAYNRMQSDILLATRAKCR